MRDDIPVVFTVDGKDRTKIWLDLALSSLRRHLGNSVQVFVCSSSKEDCVRGFGYDSVAIDVSEVIENTALSRMERIKFQGHVRGPMQVFRLALPVVDELKKFDRFVYLDADVEFRSHKWASIFDIDLGDKEVGMALDMWPVCDKTQCEAMRVFQDVCGICCDEAKERLARDMYYGAGIVIFNERKLLERGDYEERLAAMLDAMVRCDFRCLDQDALNYAMTIHQIDRRYDAWERNVPKGGEAWLWHYAGGAKFRGVYPPDLYQRMSDDGKERDVLFVVDKGRERNLRYALRSLDKYGNGIGRVVVAGYPPAWLSDDVIAVPVEQNYSSPYRNVLYTISRAIDIAGLSGHFLLAHDDFLLIRPTDMFNYPFYFRGYGIYGDEEQKTGMPKFEHWKRVLNKTRRCLAHLGLPTLDFASHRYLHFHAEMFRDHFGELNDASYCPEDIEVVDGVAVRECIQPDWMMNLWLHLDSTLPLVKESDFKIIRAPAGGLPYDLGIPEGRDCISYDDIVWTDASFRDFIEREFSGKSRYEK